MHINKLAAGIFLPVVVLLSGCVALQKLSAPSLSGSPDSSALVIVEAEAIMYGMLGIKSSQQVEGGVLLSIDGSKRIDGGAVAGLIIFSNVPAGEYNLARVQTTWNAGNMTWQHTYNVPPDKALSFVISVRVGEPKYLGIVTVEEVRKTDQRGVIFDLKQSKESEISAWEKFIELYQGSSWSADAQKRLAEVRR